MQILTTWVCYGGEIGVTLNAEYYELSTGKRLKKECYAGAIHYRAFGSKKRYSWKKCNETKVKKEIEIINIPF